MEPLQYVILRHQDIAQPHYDLMFETLPGSQLATWRSPEWPLPDKPVSLKRLKDHRRFFLSFEGELAGHRGSVAQMARGQCQVEIGENAVWTIRLLDGTSPQALTLRQIQSEEWEGSSNGGR